MKCASFWRWTLIKLYTLNWQIFQTGNWKQNFWVAGVFRGTTGGSCKKSPHTISWIPPKGLSTPLTILATFSIFWKVCTKINFRVIIGKDWLFVKNCYLNKMYFDLIQKIMTLFYKTSFYFFTSYTITRICKVKGIITDAKSWFFFSKISLFHITMWWRFEEYTSNRLQ